MQADRQSDSSAGRELDDEECVRRSLDGERESFAVLMRRYNRRLYRVARGILRDDAEAEDTVQQAYVSAYEHLDQFSFTAKFSTWLTKIALYEALARKRRQGRLEELEVADDTQTIMADKSPSPEEAVSREQARVLVERAIDTLPENYRSVVMLRDIEGMSTADTADCLDLTEETVRVRLHRARGMLRDSLYENALGAEAFGFAGDRCDRIVNRVLERLEGMWRGQAR
jgi:RNA polymerase sigma-70 factor (ECF subfamily)